MSKAKELIKLVEAINDDVLSIGSAGYTYLPIEWGKLGWIKSMNSDSVGRHWFKSPDGEIYINTKGVELRISPGADKIAKFSTYK